MKTSTIVLVGAGAAALYFLVLKPRMSAGAATVATTTTGATSPAATKAPSTGAKVFGALGSLFTSLGATSTMSASTNAARADAAGTQLGYA